MVNKIKVYEFCGYLNTPDECAGKWFDSFPYDMSGKKPEPRVGYHDHAVGYTVSPNWQCYILGEEPGSVKSYVGSIWKQIPDGATHIVDSIQRVTVSRVTAPYYIVFEDRGLIYNTEMNHEFYVWKVEYVDSFQTHDGMKICTRLPNGE